MTIRIIETPSRGESWVHVSTNVKTVTERAIVYHNGETSHKNYHAKVEILSVVDAPEAWEERKAFIRKLQGLTEADWLVNEFSRYIKMKAAEFEALDLPKNFC